MTLPNKGIRIFNCAIDLFVIAIIYSAISNLVYVPFNPSVALYICMFFYYWLFESFNGRTIGKLITNTRVVDVDNVKPAIGRILWRSILRLNPFDWMSYLFGIGYGAHDKLSRTKLISIKNNQIPWIKHLSILLSLAWLHLPLLPFSLVTKPA